MKAIKVTYADGDTVETNINGTMEEIERYYVGKWFNVGDPYDPTKDRMAQAVKVEEL